MKKWKHILTALVLGGAMMLSAQVPKKVADKATDKAAAKAPALVDINSASKSELEAIKGIGPAYSEAIMKGRPYKRKDELVDKKILPAGVYSKVKDLIIAKQK